MRLTKYDLHNCIDVPNYVPNYVPVLRGFLSLIIRLHCDWEDWSG